MKLHTKRLSKLLAAVLVLSLLLLSGCSKLPSLETGENGAGGEITISGGEVTATGGVADDSFGVYIKSSLYVKSGTLTATGTISRRVIDVTKLKIDGSTFYMR